MLGSFRTIYLILPLYLGVQAPKRKGARYPLESQLFFVANRHCHLMNRIVTTMVGTYITRRHRKGASLILRSIFPNFQLVLLSIMPKAPKAETISRQAAVRYLRTILPTYAPGTAGGKDGKFQEHHWADISKALDVLEDAEVVVEGGDETLGSTSISVEVRSKVLCLGLATPSYLAS